MIVQDNSLNAFVAGGQRIFINTGLIMRTETPNQLIGVMAHESGHIAGGHLARMQEELRNLTTLQILEAILGAGAMAGGAVSGGGMRPRRRRLDHRRRRPQGAGLADVVPALYPDPGKRRRPGGDELPAAHRPVAQGHDRVPARSCSARSACRSPGAIPT